MVTDFARAHIDRTIAAQRSRPGNFRAASTTDCAALYPIVTRLSLGIAIITLFALFHLHPVHMLVAFLLGALAAVTVVVSGSLWPAVVVHVANNSASAVPALVESEAPYWSIGFALPGVLLIGGGLMLLFRHRRHEVGNPRGV